MKKQDYQEIVNRILKEKAEHMKRVHSNYDTNKPQWERSESNPYSAHLWERADEFYEWLNNEMNDDVRNSKQRTKEASYDLCVRATATIQKILDYCDHTVPLEDPYYTEWLSKRSEEKGKSIELQTDSTEPNPEVP